MGEEKTPEWNSKRILMVVVGAIVVGGAAALQDTTQEFVKSFFALDQKSNSKDSGETSPAPAPQPTTTIGDGNIGTVVGNNNTQNIQGVQSGNNNTQNNYFTDTKRIEELSRQLGVTEPAIESFLKEFEYENVPPGELDNKLRTIAARHKELEKRVAQLESKDPAVVALQQKAREAIHGLRYELAEALLDQAAELDIAAAKKINAAYLERMRSAAENRALKAETLYTRFAFAKAIDAYEEAIQFAEDGKAGKKKSDYQNMLGNVYSDIAQYQKAIAYYELALASDRKTYGEDHPNVAIYRNNLGAAWMGLGQYQKAIEYYELALTSNLKTYGEDHPNVATRRNNLGKAWNSLGQHQKAIEYYELALPTLIDKLGPYHPNSILGSNNLEAARAALADKNQ